LAHDVMAHRLVLSFDALADGVPPRQVVDRVVAAVPLPVIAPSQETPPYELPRPETRRDAVA
ncbi:hypothetical protein ACWEPC_14995, partial [Nonomuraea sp. NPDC004297]